MQSPLRPRSAATMMSPLASSSKRWSIGNNNPMSPFSPGATISTNSNFFNNNNEEEAQVVVAVRFKPPTSLLTGGVNGGKMMGGSERGEKNGLPSNSSSNSSDPTTSSDDSIPYRINETENSVALSLGKRSLSSMVNEAEPFCFDFCFGPETTQSQVFSAVVEGMLVDVVKGYNATIFAYGQTGSGKTFTMFGPLVPPHPPNQRCTTKGGGGGGGNKQQQRRLKRMDKEDASTSSSSPKVHSPPSCSDADSLASRRPTLPNAGASEGVEGEELDDFVDDIRSNDDYLSIINNYYFPHLRSTSNIFTNIANNRIPTREFESLVSIPGGNISTCSCPRVTLPTGIIPQAVSRLFKSLSSEDSGNIQFEVIASFLEIYQEDLIDLLRPGPKLRIREHPLDGVSVEKLHYEAVTSTEDVLSLLAKGERLRHVAHTDMNEASSRSHSVFTLQVEQRFADGTIKRSQLRFADLAGSERVGKSGAEGQTLEEAKKINQSLSALGNCIAALTEKGRKHIPFRDSKLTFLLSDSLGGNSKTALILTCSSGWDDVEETISTLRFGTRAKYIKNTVHVNKRLTREELERRLKDLEILNKEMSSMNRQLSSQIVNLQAPPMNDAFTQADLVVDEEMLKHDSIQQLIQYHADVSAAAMDQATAVWNEREMRLQRKIENLQRKILDHEANAETPPKQRRIGGEGEEENDNDGNISGEWGFSLPESESRASSLALPPPPPRDDENAEEQEQEQSIVVEPSASSAVSKSFQNEEVQVDSDNARILALQRENEQLRRALFLAGGGGLLQQREVMDHKATNSKPRISPILEAEPCIKQGWMMEKGRKRLLGTLKWRRVFATLCSDGGITLKIFKSAADAKPYNVVPLKDIVLGLKTVDGVMEQRLELLSSSIMGSGSNNDDEPLNFDPVTANAQLLEISVVKGGKVSQVHVLLADTAVEAHEWFLAITRSVRLATATTTTSRVSITNTDM